MEKLLNFNSDLVRMWALNGLDSNSAHEVSPESIDYLEAMLKASTDVKYAPKLVEPAAKILTHHVICHEKGHEHGDFLADLIKCESLNPDIKGSIFRKFAADVNEINHWEDGKFDGFASLLLYDDGDHSLAKGLFSAQKNHGYTSSLERLPEFEVLLKDAKIKDAAAGFIGKSLEKLLKEPSANIGGIEPHVIKLKNETGKLGLGLVGAIFDVYRENQSHFNGLIVDLIAEDKLLPEALLKKLAEPLGKAENQNPKTALFTATRLAQHYIDLPRETLSHFIHFLNDTDEHLSLLAVNLYYQKLETIPKKLNQSLLMPCSFCCQQQVNCNILKFMIF